MKKSTFIIALFVMMTLTVLAYWRPGLKAAQNSQQTVPHAGDDTIYLPWLSRPLPSPTPTETPIPSPTATATETPTVTPTATATSLPTPPSDAYFNIAVLQGCLPNPGVTYVQGTTYVNGSPQSGYLVAFSYAPDAEIVAFIQSGPHLHYEGWSPGFYSHILKADGPREGDWYFWIMDETFHRISEIAHVHTHGEAGDGRCQQAIIDFDSRTLGNQSPTPTPTPTATTPSGGGPTPTATPTTPSGGGAAFRLVEQRLWDVVENGGHLAGESVNCGEKQVLRVIVENANQSPRDGVTIQGVYRNEIHVTGEKGPGVAELDMNVDGDDIVVLRDADGSNVTSDRASGNTARTANIPFHQLIQARYCTNDESCQRFVDTNGCFGHFSWTVRFRKQ